MTSKQRGRHQRTKALTIQQRNSATYKIVKYTCTKSEPSPVKWYGLDYYHKP